MPNHTNLQTSTYIYVTQIFNIYLTVTVPVGVNSKLQNGEHSR
jgi:hypothetical protein